MRKRRKDDVMTEIWKPIKGFEECYEVSNMVTVKNRFEEDCHVKRYRMEGGN